MAVSGSPRLLLFGDASGVGQLVSWLPPSTIVGIVAASDRPSGHEGLKDFARVLRVPILVQPTRNDGGYAEWVQALSALRPDLIVVESYSMWLPPEVLDIPSNGAVNIHGALLPDYRGANPIQWALIGDETQTGVTMHRVSPRIDGGEIIAQELVPVLFEDTWIDVRDRIMAATDLMLARELPRLLSGRSRSARQDDSSARSFPRRRPEDGAIDWELPVRRIYNLVRALVHPLPGAFYDDGSHRVTLDSFLPVADIAQLKSSLLPTSMPVAGTLSLRVMSSEPGSRQEMNSRIAFTLVDACGVDNGICELRDCDYRSGTARTFVPATLGEERRGAVDDALRSFAEAELGIGHVDAG